MDKKHVLIISEHPADFYSLTAALERAEPPRFKPVTVNTRDQPVDALMDPANDAVILAYTLETEYLLRLAQKKHLTLPIIVLIDHETDTLVGKLKEAGATDYIVRGLISDDMLHRVLDYSMVLSHVTMQHEQVLKQQSIERAAQQAGEHLQSVAEAAGDSSVVRAAPPAGPVGGAPVSPEEPAVAAPGPEPGPEAIRPTVAGSPRALSRPWKWGIVALAAGILLVGAALLSQRLENESRLSRLEASNDILSQQLTQLHSDLTRGALTPASGAVATETAEPRMTSPVLPAPASGAAATEARLPPAPAVAAPAIETVEPVSANPAEPSSPVPETTEVIDAPPPVPVPIPSRDSEPLPAPQTGPAEVPGGPWFINLGTFSSQGAARRFAHSLEPTSHQLNIMPVRVGENDLYRVRLQGLPSEELAEALATDYQITLGGGRPWVGRD